MIARTLTMATLFASSQLLNKSLDYLLCILNYQKMENHSSYHYHLSLHSWTKHTTRTRVLKLQSVSPAADYMEALTIETKSYSVFFQWKTSIQWLMQKNFAWEWFHTRTITLSFCASCLFMS